MNIVLVEAKGNSDENIKEYGDGVLCLVLGVMWREMDFTSDIVYL